MGTNSCEPPVEIRVVVLKPGIKGLRFPCWICSARPVQWREEDQGYDFGDMVSHELELPDGQDSMVVKLHGGMIRLVRGKAPLEHDNGNS